MPMQTGLDPQAATHSPDASAARRRHEAAMIAQARAEIAAGQGIGESALEEWLDALDVDASAPVPLSRQPA